MYKKLLAMILATMLWHLVTAPAAVASSKAEKQAQLTEKVKVGIAGLGIGPQARVEVKLRDQTKLVGYVSEITDEAFVVTNVKSGMATSVAYANVTQAKGHNLSTGAKVAIGVGVGVGIAVIVLLIFIKAIDNT